MHKKSWAVIDRPYSLGCATVGALYERPRCIFLCKAVSTGDRIIPGKLKCHENLALLVECMIDPPSCARDHYFLQFLVRACSLDGLNFRIGHSTI